MNGKLTTVLMLSGALATGGTAAYFADRHIDRAITERRAELEAQYQPLQVVVASADLRAGAVLSNQVIAQRDVPRSFLHSDAIPADEWSRISGRVLIRPLRAGEPLLMSHVAQAPGAGFSAQLEQGMRALTFPVDEEASISGMLAPSDRIDMLFTTTSGNEAVTLPLLLNVPVIATGIRTTSNEAFLAGEPSPGPYRTITVSVTPEDAAKITLAQDAGKITIALRQSQDVLPIQIGRVTKSTLLSGAHTRPKVTSRAPIEIILGGL
jgi:pilus assembly protein CpaB